MDPVKTRFVRANSAIAFPRILGMDLESEAIPRLHSFAWHTGIRAEPIEDPVDITSMVTWVDTQRFAKTYFTVVKPEIGLLDETEFTEQAAARFANPGGYSDLDAVILGVAALGSFFSNNPHPRENEFIFGARNVLTQKLMNHSPTANNVAGWILRTIWLRLASRPHGSWMSSSITMHQAEACGLHKEMQTIAVVYPAAPAGDHKLSKTRRRLFWIGRALNIILSFEYGRSRINFDVVTTKRPASESGSHGHQFIELAELLPNDFVDREREPDPPAALGNALTKIEEMQTESSFITLLRADLAFAIYRRLWLMSLTDAKDRAESVMNVGKQALHASAKLLDSNIPWWNVLHAPFQFLCVVLAVGTPKSLSHISDIMKLLRRVATTYDNHMTREAFNQATALVKMTQKRKEKELEALSVLPELLPFSDHPSVGSSGMTEAPNLDWAMDLPFEWDVFLNPDLVVSQQQAQSAVDMSYGGQLGFQM
nr:protein rdr1 [Quercus suber]